VEQLEVLGEVVAAFGFLVAKAPGYEPDDFLAAAAREWPGDVLVATSDRDAFQLASERVTILQPTRGVSELARIGPTEVRERYGVEPEQVPDLIALRGDPSDKLPGARGIGPKKAAELLAQYGSLEAALADGRFAVEAEDLRLFRRIATMDASAPLPPLAETSPAWAEASSFLARLGLDGVAGRVGAVALSGRIPPWRGCIRPATTPSGPSASRCCSSTSTSGARAGLRRPRSCSSATPRSMSSSCGRSTMSSGSTATPSARRRRSRRPR